MTNTQPVPCTESEFVKAQVSNPTQGWKQAGNGESFRIQGEHSLKYYVRTGRQYWAFDYKETISHGAIMSLVHEAMMEAA